MPPEPEAFEVEAEEADEIDEEEPMVETTEDKELRLGLMVEPGLEPTLGLELLEEEFWD